MRKICIFCLVFSFVLLGFSFLIEAINLKGYCAAHCFKSDGCKYNNSCDCADTPRLKKDCSCSSMGTCGITCSWMSTDLAGHWERHIVEKSCNDGAGGGKYPRTPDTP